ncbi:gene transfer agent family protein [Shinella yambaruensis]|uniref:Gene transfer agent family protein n=1 Tax=Shinella yambaruensis TaxID=415996 RepID=A0ABQ5ZWQ4_9HYPH|nr:gene transfer agent family protein [Shinella yambaruensis]MCJ8030012.1 gene transfer agent family protein [Shinella yambaruensis]MCU7984304.1 gene transfer agent family protein [Shinella yambaruensis]GLR55132.1 hypothetical protein GCM10007923_63530 [Shinella yambaruensis]
MSRVLDLPFGGAKRKFRLGIGELRELQDVCKAGPATVLARLASYQPQAEFLRRPNPEDFQLGAGDADFLGALNLFSMVRQIGGDWRIDDVRETLRLGLIGGGMSPSEAYFYITKYVDEAGEWTENIARAAQVLAHALLGEQDDPPKKAKAETTTAETAV